MKAARQRALRRLLEDDEPRTQRELMSLLGGRGFEVTQATVSRDLAELGAIRTRVNGGGTAYTLGRESRPGAKSIESLRRHLAGSVEAVAVSGDLVVVKTLPGHAQFVASAIDGAGIRNILGTVGGDDTILVVAKPRKGRKVKEVLEQVGEMGATSG